MTQEGFYEETEKKVIAFLENNWKEGFNLWLNSVANSIEAFEEALPKDTPRYRMYYMQHKIPEKIVYQIGFNSGQQMYNWFFRLLEDFGFREASIKEVMTLSNIFFKHLGLGEITFIKEKGRPYRILRFEEGTYFARMKKKKKLFCQYVAGFIGGGTKSIMNKEYKVREVKCVCDGDPCCEFIIHQK